jgi:cyclohexa-1,5-dienecarbonyl-CoA hydratase
MKPTMKYIQLVVKDKIARITLNRPPLNILNIEMMQELNSILEDLINKDIKLVVICANGKMFSAGVDIKDHTPEKVEDMLMQFHKIFENLDALKPPTIALVKGAAIGGGCELATFCDFVIASKNATFSQPEIKVGVFPPVAAVKFPKMIGLKKTFALVLSGDTISAEDAEKIGLITKCIDDDEFESFAQNYIQNLASYSGVVLKLAKQCIREAYDLSYTNGIKNAEDIYLQKLMLTEDAKEGLDAFIYKRKPVWKDK